MIATISKWGNSQGVRLPKTILDEAGLDESDSVELIALKDNIVLKKLTVLEKPRMPHKTIMERFQNYDGTLEQKEIDWGPPVGDEVW